MSKAQKTFKETDERIAAELVAKIDAYEADGNAKGWTMPWDALSGFPVNATTGRSYGGSYNAMIMLFAGANYGDQRWAGASQWKKTGNFVKKGEKGLTIFFPRFLCASCDNFAGFAKKCKKCGNDLNKAGGKKMIGFGTSVVFNNQQTQNPIPVPEVKEVDPQVGFKAAADLVSKAGADVRHGGGRAYYRPSDDFIMLPEAGSFHTVADYWATSLHEHAHWTGHSSRLNRKGVASIGSGGREAYAYEELVAEIAASFLCKHVGVDREGLDTQHVAYLASWRKAVKSDPTIIRKAVGEAGQVLRFLTK